MPGARHWGAVLVVYVTSFCDGDDKHGHGLVVDGIDHAQVADAVAVGAGELAFERLDVVTCSGVCLKRLETPGEFLRKRLVAALIEPLSLARKLDLIHRPVHQIAPCAMAWCGQP